MCVYVRSEFLQTDNMYITVLWNEMPCILTNIPVFPRSLVLLWPGRPQFIDADDGCSLLLWNISKRMPHYMRLLPKRRISNLSNLFLNRTLHISDRVSVHHQEFFTVRIAMVYVIQQMLLLTSCQQTCMTYTIAVCTVKNSWWWTETLSEICRVLFKNKFEKLVHLVGFIVRIYHETRSRERKKKKRHILLSKRSRFCSRFMSPGEKTETWNVLASEMRRRVFW